MGTAMDKNTRIEILPFQYGVVLAQVDSKSDRPLFWEILTAEDAKAVARKLSDAAKTTEIAAMQLAAAAIAKAKI